MKHKTIRFVTITSNAYKNEIQNDVLLKTQQTHTHTPTDTYHLSQQLPFQLIKSRRTYVLHKETRKMAKWMDNNTTTHWDIKCDNTKLFNTFVVFVCVSSMSYMCYARCSNVQKNRKIDIEIGLDGKYLYHTKTTMHGTFAVVSF